MSDLRGKVSMVSFVSQYHSDARNVLDGEGINLQPWHIQELELFLERMKKRLADRDCPDASDLV